MQRRRRHYYHLNTNQLGWYSEMGFHIGMDRNFVGLWRRHNCRSQVIDLSLSALISRFVKSIIGFLNNSNLHAIISTSLIINFIDPKKFILLYQKKFNVVPHWSAVLISRNHTITCHISFTKKTFQIRDQFFLYVYMDPEKIGGEARRPRSWSNRQHYFLKGNGSRD